MKNIILYIVTVLIWGSTWIAIKYQLGEVDPIISIVYRFGSASVLLLFYCYIKGLSLRFSLKEHFFMGLLGLFLFSIQLWLVYTVEGFLSSGIVAVVYSSVVFLNIINGYIFLKTPVYKKTIVGAIIGISGIIMIFMSEISSLKLSDKGIYGLSLLIIGAFLYSIGNIISARNTKNKLPILQANAFGMGYGTILLLLIAIFTGSNFSFDVSASYIGSLFYLSVFGSIIGFSTYLTLIGNIGANKAAYTTMLIPIVALIISSFVEDYNWSPFAIVGIVLVIGGNFLALSKQRKSSFIKSRISLSKH